MFDRIVTTRSSVIRAICFVSEAASNSGDRFDLLDVGTNLALCDLKLVDCL
jgi:hypothetical protein